MFPSILIVDDEPSIVQSLSGILSDEGFEVMTAENGYEALKQIESESPDLVLLDIWMPGIDGVETLKLIKKASPFLQVIIITGHGNIETAVTATKLGAFDLLEKPLSIDKVIVSINNALNFRRLEEENRYLRKKTLEKHAITGNSPAITTLKQQIGLTAPTDAWVMITGENGVGKELVARTIHLLSGRADQSLIDVNCATLTDELLESELFGREKASGEGGGSRKRGKLELAYGGTIFLDEIGDMSLVNQGKILRVLQEQRFCRVGGNRSIRMDVRVIAASNKDLKKEIEKGLFREDLYYRLNVIPIHIPPLRERKEDIPLLAQTFIKDAAGAQRIERNKTIDPAVFEVLGEYEWPGNARELKNLMERLTIMSEGPVISVEDLPSPYRRDALEPIQWNSSNLLHAPTWREAIEGFEERFIRHKLAYFNQDAVKTAETIGVTLDTVKRFLPA